MTVAGPSLGTQTGRATGSIPDPALGGPTAM